MKKIYYCGYLDANCDKLKELQEALNELMEHKDAEFDKCIKLQEENKQLKEKLDNCIINSSNVYKQQKADFIEELKGKVNGFKLHIGNLNGIIKRLEENEEIILEELNNKRLKNEL